MAGSHTSLFLAGLLLATVCLTHSQPRKAVKRFPSVYRTREVVENSGGEAYDIGSMVDSMHKALLLLEHRIMNLETNERNLYERLEDIEAMLFSPSAENEQAGDITGQPQVAGSNSSNDLPTGIKNYVPSKSNASDGANAQNGVNEGNNQGAQSTDKDEGDNQQGNVVALLEDAEAAIAEAADILSNQNNPEKPETVTAGKDSGSSGNVDVEDAGKSSEEVDDQPGDGDEDVAVHNKNHTSSDKTPDQNDVMVGSSENEQPTGDVEIHNENPPSTEVTPDQNDVMAESSDEQEDEVENAENVGKTEGDSQQEQAKTESYDGVGKRYGVDQQQQVPGENRSFRFHRRLLPYNRRVSIHSGN